MKDRESLIMRTTSGYERDDGSARYVYDKKGRYLGQWQPDMLSDDPGAGEIYCKTYSGDRCYHELSLAEILGAA